MQIIVTIKNKKKTAPEPKWKELQQFRLVLCSFCVEVPHKKMKYIDSTYMAPTSWRVKDHVANTVDRINTICDPLWKNRPLAIFREFRVLGMDRCRICCRVQRSKSQVKKRLLGRVMPQKLYTGHPCLSSQFFEKRSVLYVHSSTFNVSVYAPYHATRFVKIMNLPGKKAEDHEAIDGTMKPRKGWKKVCRVSCLGRCLCWLYCLCPGCGPT